MIFAVSEHGFLSVRAGDFVVVEDVPIKSFDKEIEWWIGCVLFRVRGARDGSTNTIFQVFNIDTGNVICINADQVTRILKRGTKI